MSNTWEVDPETRAKLSEIQKSNGNSTCVDCNSPNPQWASPKFGVFMCLNCSGIHRGLGVHVSFIRSVTMDGFKGSEISRMQLGGNKPWQEFFNAHEMNQLEGRTFEDSTIKDRYDSDVGEEWKDRLAAKVEGTDYVPGQKPPRPKPAPTSSSASGSRSQTPSSQMRGSGMNSARSQSPMKNSKKAQTEAYFAKIGAENASRPDDLPPNQGGKYDGFGSQPMPAKDDSDWIKEMQKDPLAGLTKGFGWLGRNVQTGYDGWVKPNVQKLGETDLAAQARMAATQIGSAGQSGFKNASGAFQRFVEGDDTHSGNRGRAGTGESLSANEKDFWDSFGSPPPGPDSEKKDFWDSFGSAPKGPSKDKKDFWDAFGAAPKGPPAEKKDFWDSFAAVGDANHKASGNIGTAAMKKGGPGADGKKDDDWGEW